MAVRSPSTCRPAPAAPEKHHPFNRRLSLPVDNPIPLANGHGKPPSLPRSTTLPHTPQLSSNLNPASPGRRAMESRYYHRPSSPGSRRLQNPGRATTGSFSSYDPYYDSYARSPRSSGDRLVPSSSASNYSTAPSAATRATAGYDAYSGRPRSSTLEGSRRPASTAGAGVPIRTTTHSTVVHTHDRPTSPLPRPYDSRGSSYAVSTSSAASVPRPSSRQGHSHGHKKFYSIDDGKAVRVDPREAEIRRHNGHSRSSSKAYHTTTQRYPVQDIGDDGYSYTDAAGMYRDTEPSWRARSGSVESRSRRPLSMVESYGPRSSARDLNGPPVTTRGFDKINGSIAAGAAVGRTGSLRDHGHARTSSRERSRERSGTSDSFYREENPYAPPARSSSVRAPALHQDISDRRDDRRDDRREDRYGYRDEYEDRDRLRTSRRYDDPDVETRGFGIRASNVARPSSVGPGNDPYHSARDEILDRRIPPPPPLAVPAYPLSPGVPVPSAHDYIPEPPRSARLESTDRHSGDFRDYDRERPRDRNLDRDWDRPKGYDRDRDRDRDREDRRDDRRERDSHIPSVVPAAAAAAVGAAYGAQHLAESAAARHHRDRDREHRTDSDEEKKRRARNDSDEEQKRRTRNDSDEEKKRRTRNDSDEERKRRARNPPSDDGEAPRERHYVEKDDVKDREERKTYPPTIDPDEEYRRRLQQELERSTGSVRDRDSDSDREKEHRRRERERDEHVPRDRLAESSSRDIPRADRNGDLKPEPKPDRYAERSNSVFGEPIVDEPASLSAAEEKERENRVRIVSPPKADKDSPPPPKGILRKPTAKFPEDPNPIREGVAPLKDAKKGKDIPPDARWTKIDRRLVNPEALEEAKERFEERMDCVIVLRVLTREDIQKLADRTREIRESRGNNPPDSAALYSSLFADSKRSLAHSSSGSSSEGTGQGGDHDGDRHSSSDHKHHRKHRSRSRRRHVDEEEDKHHSHHHHHHDRDPISSSALSDSSEKSSKSKALTGLLDTVIDVLTRPKEEEYHSSSRGSGDRERDLRGDRGDRDTRDHRSNNHRSSRRKHKDNRDDDDGDDLSYESDLDDEIREKERERPRMIEPSREPREDFRDREREREKEREREREFWMDPSRR